MKKKDVASASLPITEHPIQLVGGPADGALIVLADPHPCIPHTTYYRISTTGGGEPLVYRRDRGRRRRRVLRLLPEGAPEGEVVTTLPEPVDLTAWGWVLSVGHRVPEPSDPIWRLRADEEVPEPTSDEETDASDPWSPHDGDER